MTFQGKAFGVLVNIGVMGLSSFVNNQEADIVIQLLLPPLR